MQIAFIGIVKLIGYSLFARLMVGAYIRKGLGEPLAFDNSGRICVSRYCQVCGYNVRGLPPNGKCPECGTVYSANSDGNLLDTPPSSREHPLLIGLVRTIIGMAVGIAYWYLLVPLVTQKSPLASPGAWILLIPIRAAEWAATIAIFFRRYRDRTTDIVLVSLGTLWSYALDFPVAFGFCVAFGGPIC